jgi:hypothetical protein
MAYYVIIRPEDFKLCVRKTREPKTRIKAMPLPKRAIITPTNSSSVLAAHDAEENASLFKALILDLENTLTQLGKSGIIMLKAGLKSGYQLSLGVNKEYSNISRPTLIECVEAYLLGEFD